MIYRPKLQIQGLKLYFKKNKWYFRVIQGLFTVKKCIYSLKVRDGLKETEECDVFKHIQFHCAFIKVFNMIIAQNKKIQLEYNSACVYILYTLCAKCIFSPNCTYNTIPLWSIDLVILARLVNLVLNPHFVDIKRAYFVRIPDFDSGHRIEIGLFFPSQNRLVKRY